MPVAENAATIAYGFCESLPKCNTDVFYRVVSIDVQVPVGLDIEVNHPVTRYLIEHVLEKG
jgi:hypothetical protein